MGSCTDSWNALMRHCLELLPECRIARSGVGLEPMETGRHAGKPFLA
ncbi:MAG: hypothetical protein MUP55_01465 [Candidatus Aenigmarchaeota archaeon]|nr:hypothetical protein [Candidatus Aenigmarchaeota archaeon]